MENQIALQKNFNFYYDNYIVPSMHPCSTTLPNGDHMSVKNSSNIFDDCGVNQIANGKVYANSADFGQSNIVTGPVNVYCAKTSQSKDSVIAKSNQENSYASMSISSPSSLSSPFDCITTSTKILDYTNPNYSSENSFGKTQHAHRDSFGAVQEQFNPSVQYNSNYNSNAVDCSNSYTTNWQSCDLSVMNQHRNFYNTENPSSCYSSYKSPSLTTANEQSSSTTYPSQCNVMTPDWATIKNSYSPQTNNQPPYYNYNGYQNKNFDENPRDFSETHYEQKSYFASSVPTSQNVGYSKPMKMQGEKILHKRKVILKEEYEVQTYMCNACSTLSLSGQNVDSCDTCKAMFRKFLTKSNSHNKYKEKKASLSGTLKVDMVYNSKSKSLKKCAKNPQKFTFREINSKNVDVQKTTSRQTIMKNKINFNSCVKNEINDLKITRQSHEMLVYSIKMAVMGKKCEIRELLNMSACQYTVEQFKSLVARHLFELTLTIVNCISTHINSVKPFAVSESTYQIYDHHLDKILVLAYVNLVDNIENFIFQLHAHVNNSEYFKLTLDKIYLNLVHQQANEVNTSEFYDRLSQTNSCQTGYYTERSKNMYAYQQSLVTKVPNETNQILCTTNELKILHFTLILFSYLTNYDNCSVGVAYVNGGNTTSQVDAHSASISSVGILCMKVVNQLVDNLCSDKIVKRKILLNLSEFDGF